MGNNGFEMSVFNHTEFLNGFANFENTKRVRVDMILKIKDEGHRNDILARCIMFITSRVLSKGYSIEYNEVGRKFSVSDNYINTVLNRLWTPELQKALEIGIYFGMYVVKYIESEVTDGIQTTFRPYVMDPDDYYIRFRKNKDGRREYAAFYSGQGSIDTPVERSRVMIFYDCTSDGDLNSPVQKALEPIIELREYWQRNGVTGTKNTFPMTHYYTEQTGQKLIPNKLDPGAVTPFEDDFGIDPDRGDAQEYGKLNNIDQTTRFYDRLLSNQMTVNPENKKYGVDEKYDPLNRRFQYVAREDPALPFIVLPSGLRVETAEHRATYDPHFKEITADLVHRICGDLGVPSEYVYDTGRKYSADFELTRDSIKSTTEYWQKQLEQHIVTFYLDLYYQDIAKRIDAVFKTADQMLNLEASKNPDATIKGSLKRTDKQMLEQNITITVRFASNPVLRAVDTQWLKEQRVISKETFKVLSLDVFGLSHALLMTEEEEKEEDVQDAKRQKLMADLGPQPAPTASGQPGKPAKPKAKPEAKPTPAPT